MNERAHHPFIVFAQYLQKQAQREASRLYPMPAYEAANVNIKNTVSAKVLATSVSQSPNTSSSTAVTVPYSRICLFYFLLEKRDVDELARTLLKTFYSFNLSLSLNICVDFRDLTCQHIC